MCEEAEKQAIEEVTIFNNEFARPVLKLLDGKTFSDAISSLRGCISILEKQHEKALFSFEEANSLLRK